MTRFRKSIPPEMVTHTIAMCGQRGEAWLDELPSVIRELESRWSITVGEPFAGIEFNYVAAAIDESGQRFVLKIAPPFDNTEILSEAKFLKTADGNGAIRLVNEDRELRAILLERAVPGSNLAELFEGNEIGVIDPAIEVLKSVVRTVPNDLSDTIELDDWFDGLRRCAATSFPAQYGKKALRLYEGVLTRSAEKQYLHGDFHPANIVSATRSPFLAIDPKGIIGPIGYDIAVFLNNFHWWQETLPEVQSRLDSAVKKFSDAFDMDPTELRQWAYTQMVLSAWWTFDEMPEIYNNEVAKADIWDI